MAGVPFKLAVGVYFVLLYIGAIFTLGLMILPETLPYPKRRVQWRGIVINYAKLLTNQQVTSSASYNWLSYLASLVTLSICPFCSKTARYDRSRLRLDPYYSLFRFIIGQRACKHADFSFSVRQLLGCAISLMVFAGLWLLLTEFSVFNLIWAFTWLSIAQGISFHWLQRFCYHLINHKRGRFLRFLVRFRWGSQVYWEDIWWSIG